MKIVAFIPIKLSSKRFPNKNISVLENGKPLISFIQETLYSVDIVDEVYVFCSDSSIQRYIIPGVEFLQRPLYLDEDNANATDLIASFIELIDADIYIMAHATSPFTKASTIHKAVVSVKSGQYDSAYPVEKIQKFAWFNGRPLNYRPDKIPRTQDVEPIYIEAANPFVFTKESFVNTNSRIGTNPLRINLTWYELIDIDLPEDFERANLFLSFLKTNKCIQP